ncbi:type I-E CRISPR-associated protein Cse1/CasA [Microbacterium sp.]|uniref:type I-E CRISPR-associated protein Cse1/CasA n=1 Tax=Microbacterium sp. TaxID=51671 RepID=UPI003C740B7E
MNEIPRFNLVDDPWIAARFIDGGYREVSIREAFHDAASIRDLAGELPTQTFAITRLLLAILYRAAPWNDAGDAWPDGTWANWWRSGLPLADVDEYLDAFRDRFDLFDASRPFFQVACLRTAKDEVKDTSGLILDLPSNNRLFTNRSGTESLQLAFPEAARWLVNAQAFDPSGIKSGAVGDPRVKGGRGYPIGLAWSGNLGGLLVEGSHLSETLLLNLVPPGELLRVDAHSDIPPWEESDADGPAERPGLFPTGPARLYTWQSRRIRLVTDGDRVTGVVVANGDALTPQNQFDHEAMTAWRYSEPQSKKLGLTTYMPREHQQGRAFWRGINALLPQESSHNAKGIDRFRPSAVYRHLGERSELGEITPGYQLRTRAIGVIYGSNNSVVDDVLDDRVDMNVALLEARNAELASEAINAVRLADDGVKALWNLASNLARAAGGGDGDCEGERSRADAAAFAALDGEYRRWLADLRDGTDAARAITAWKATASHILRSLGDELIASAGSAAWAGREVRGLSGTILLNTPRAAGIFSSALHKAFGAPQPADAPEGNAA